MAPHTNPSPSVIETDASSCTHESMSTMKSPDDVTQTSRPSVDVQLDSTINPSSSASTHPTNTITTKGNKARGRAIIDTTKHIKRQVLRRASCALPMTSISASGSDDICGDLNTRTKTHRQIHWPRTGIARTMAAVKRDNNVTLDKLITSFPRSAYELISSINNDPCEEDADDDAGDTDPNNNARETKITIDDDHTDIENRSEDEADQDDSDPWLTKLIEASKSNNITDLEAILEATEAVRIDTQSSNQSTSMPPISLSDINTYDSYRWTALMYSCYYGHADVAKRLLIAGAHADASDEDHMSCLIWAAGRGHLECVSHLIQIGKAKVNQADKFGTSSLIWACRKGHTQIAAVLLKAGANVDCIGVLGWSPLMVAVYGNHIDIIKLLLQYKPNVNTCDIQRYTPLMVASKDGKVEIVSMLLKARAFVNLSDEQGHTALIHAARKGHVDVIDLLLKHNADINHRDLDRKSALYWAVEKNHLDVVERLLQRGADVDLKSKDGDTCLSKAKKLRKDAIVRVLEAHVTNTSVIF